MSARRRTVALGGLIATLITATNALRGQSPRTTHEVRVDGVVARETALEAGASVNIPAGLYMRTALTAAAGIAAGGGRTGSTERFEIVSRFVLDPFRESPYGLSVGGGLGVTNLGTGSRWRPYLAAVLDLELKRAGAFTPAIQFGFGGGTRLGVILRSGAADRFR